MRIKKYTANILLLLISFIVSLSIAEYAYRKIIFGTNPKFKNLRKPELYADYFNDDDYWKLYHLFGGEYGAPKQPHPLLGWIGDFDRTTLLHNKTDSIKGRRPVLLYGDSYASCVDAECFQSLLNSDRDFAQSCYLLNYGVGGYAVDQIDLLFKHTYKKYEKPFVVFSIMCSDLDRSILTSRMGQKPYFTIEHDSLVLQGVPIDSAPEHFFATHPPQIKSYLWRRLVYSPHNPLPDATKAWLKGEDKINNYKMELNEKILQDAVDELKRNKIDFVFLVFHYIQRNNYEFSLTNEDNWRDKFLRDFIKRSDIPYIWSKDIIKSDTAYKDNIEKYINQDNGHPTTYLNRLICDKIKTFILK